MQTVRPPGSDKLQVQLSSADAGVGGRQLPRVGRLGGHERQMGIGHRDPMIPRAWPHTLYISQSENDLEVTYLVRLFAEFESALRSFWRPNRGKKKKTRPQTKQLLDLIASIRKIGYTELKNAHTVRDYRNVLIHDNELDENVDPISIEEARRRLMLYFMRLPYEMVSNRNQFQFVLYYPDGVGLCVEMKSLTKS